MQKFNSFLYFIIFEICKLKINKILKKQFDGEICWIYNVEMSKNNLRMKFVECIMLKCQKTIWWWNLLNL